jgi:hypothetical protein
MGNTLGGFRDSSSNRQRQTEGQEIWNQSQRPEHRRPPHQDFTYNPPRHAQDRGEQPTQGTGQERRTLHRTHRIQNLISPLASEQFSRMMIEHSGRLTNQEHEEESEIIKIWCDQQVNDLHSKLDPTDKPASSNSGEEQSLTFVEEINMQMIVYERQKESLIDKYNTIGEDINRDQEIERMMQLHDQNREKLVEIILENRRKKGDTLGKIPHPGRKAELEDMINEKIQEYINKKDE